MKIHYHLHYRISVLEISLILCVAVVALICLSIFVGPVSVSYLDFVAVFRGQESPLSLVANMRLLHTAAVVGTGVSLAFAGSVLQKLLRNPLADPFILGVSSGGGFFAALVIVFQIQFGFFLFGSRVLAAFVGSFISLFLVIFLRKLFSGVREEYGIIVTGLILNSFFGSAISLIVSLSAPERSTEIFRWMMGDITSITGTELLLFLGLILACVFVLFRYIPAVRALSFGDDIAKNVGFSAASARRFLLIVVSILIASVVSVGGSIGYIGLIVPHMSRSLCKGDLAQEWGMSCVLGAVTLLIADIAARTANSPAELPVGIFTALIGVPGLFFVLWRRGRQYE